MTPYRNAMDSFLNFHTHRMAVSPSETVIRNLPYPFSAHDEDGLTGSGWFSAGIHPWHIPEDCGPVFDRLSHLWRSPHCAALGETGLDKCCRTPFPLQKEVFVRQLEAAAAYGLPVVIHCVRAWGELLEVHKDIRPSVPCIVHGFRGGPALARQLLDKGFYLSFGFRFNTQSLAECPSVRLFLETDEDARSVEELYHTAARLRGCLPSELGLQCRSNLHDIFRHPSVNKTDSLFA